MPSEIVQRPELRSQLTGPGPYWKFHQPRLLAHPGPVAVIGCLNFGAYSHAVAALGKRVIGVDPQAPAQAPGFEVIQAAVAPFRGTAVLHGVDHGASLYWRQKPEIATVRCITMQDVRDAAGGDLAALQMNAEGAEAFVILEMCEPYADQITVAFHDRPGADPTKEIGTSEIYLPDMRDGLIRHLLRWYDCVQLTPRTDNDWWFFLRRNSP